MKTVIQRLFKCILFLALLALTAGFFFRAFTPDDGNYVLPEDFYRKPDDRFDVLFVGTSLIKQGVLPMALYEEYGISSYNLGTGDQTVALSYYLLKDAIERQHPKLVVLEIGRGDETTYESPEDVHYISDHMPFFSQGRYDLIRGVSKGDEDTLRFLFPWYEYHSRWTTLTGQDLIHEDSGAAYGSWVLAQGKDSGYFEPAKPNPNYKLPSIVTEYTEKIIELCRANDTQLLFLTLPMFGPGMLPAEYYPQIVTESSAVEKFAIAHEVQCLNLLTQTRSFGLKAETDTLDGMHLNLSGAEKFTSQLGQMLKYLCDLPDHRDEKGYEFMADDYEKYTSFRSRRLLASDNHVTSYFEGMRETYDTENYLYVFTAAGDTTGSMTDTVKSALRSLGLVQAESAAGDHPYIAVIDRGEVVYETNDFSLTSDSYEARVDGVSVKALSRSSEEGSEARVILGRNNYELPGPGLNVVVFDKKTGKKVDAAYLRGDVVEHKLSPAMLNPPAASSR